MPVVISWIKYWLQKQQECIPVGCVPPAAVALHEVGWSASVHAGIHNPPGLGLENPQVWTWRPPLPVVGIETPWMWAWRPLLGLGLETPLGMGLETPLVWAWRPPSHTPQLPPGVWAWRDLQGMLGYQLQCMLGYHPPPCG